MNKYLLLAFLATSLSACDLEFGTLFTETAPPPFVCDSTQATVPVDNFLVKGSFTHQQVSDGSKILLLGNDILYWYDFNTGVLLNEVKSWEADQAFDYTHSIYRHGDLTLAASRWHLAAFNVKTGKLAWQRGLDGHTIHNGVVGLGDQYFIVQTIKEADGVNEHAVFSGHVQDPDHLELLAQPAYSRLAKRDWTGYGEITALAPYTGADGHNYLLTAFAEPLPDTYTLANFVGLFDITTQSWVYERRPIAGEPLIPICKIEHLVVTGPNACFALGHKLIDWDLAAGSMLDSFLIFEPQAPYSNVDTPIEELWVNEHYAVIRTNTVNIQVFDRTNHTALYRLDRIADPVQVDLSLNRIFVIFRDSIEVYELSSGGKKDFLLPPCEGYARDVKVWKDSLSVIHMAAETQAVQIYHYILSD